jgi:hypothetical protein
MDLTKKFEDLIQWGLKNTENKKALINMSSTLIATVNSTDKKELSKESLEKISAGLVGHPWTPGWHHP